VKFKTNCFIVGPFQLVIQNEFEDDYFEDDYFEDDDSDDDEFEEGVLTLSKRARLQRFESKSFFLLKIKLILN